MERFAILRVYLLYCGLKYRILIHEAKRTEVYQTHRVSRTKVAVKLRMQIVAHE